MYIYRVRGLGWRLESVGREAQGVAFTDEGAWRKAQGSCIARNAQVGWCYQ